MLEAIVLLIVSGLVAVCAFSSQGRGTSLFAKWAGKSKASTVAAGQNALVSSSEVSTSYLEQLQREIEATLFPRPTDSVLRRHYDTLVASEVKNRLSFFS